MRRVLIITYYWPPAGGSGVQRWLKTAKYLPQFGWEPVIYTPKNPDVNSIDESLSRDISPDLKVIKRKIAEPYGFYKILTGKKKGDKLPANLISGPQDKGADGGSKKTGGLMHRISMYIRANWFIPDPRCWWIKPSVKYLSKVISEKRIPSKDIFCGNSGKEDLQDFSFDAIISTGTPHSMHLIAQKLHRKFNIPWVADFRDPWTKIFYFKYLGLSGRSMRKHQKLEHSVVADADFVTVVSQKMKEDFSTGEYLAFRDKIKTVANGYDPDDFSYENNPSLIAAKEDIEKFLAETDCSNRDEDNTASSRKFVIAHTGLMIENANPDKFWKVLGDAVKKDARLKERLVIAFMGQTPASVKKNIEDCGLLDCFKDFGYVPHATSVAWQKRADLLLLSLSRGIESKAILTGKFFEYMASGGRILAFGPIDGDLASVLKKTGGGVVCGFEDEAGISEAFSKEWEAFCTDENKLRENRNFSDEQMSERLKYSRIAAAEKFAVILDNACKQKHKA